MSKTLFIITGAAAWIGGIATAMAALSCDVETCETDPQPSAIVRFWTQDGSARVPVQGDSVRFQVHPTGGDPQADLATPPALQNGRCLDRACSEWALGSDQAGRLQIWAEACERSYTAEATVELDALACHAVTQYVDIEVDDALCPVGPERIPPWDCDKMAHPSVHVVVAKRYDDYFAPVDVDMVWFEAHGRTFEARCIRGDDGTCNAWIAGYELEGPITVSTEHCDTVVSQTVDVRPIPDSCHVQTEYMMLEVSTRGCLTAEVVEADPPPPPQWPWDLTTATIDDRPDAATDLTARPRAMHPEGADDLITKPRDIHPDPFRPTEFVDQPHDAERPQGAATDLTTEQRFPPPPGAPDGVASPD
jgi:hypothetical protein